MKKIFLLTAVALAAIAAASCNKPVPEQMPEAIAQDTYGNLRVNFRMPAPAGVTKALTTATDETKINSVHVFVFNKETKKRETDRYEQIPATATAIHDSYTMTLTSLTGSKIVWAVLNSPRITDVVDETALKQKVSDLGENSVTGLLMTGFNDNVTVAETNANVPSQQDVVTDAAISVYRLGARISLEKVTVDFSGTDLDGATFEVTGLYLKNVAGKVRLDGESSGAGIDLGQPASWYNLGNQAAVNAAPAAVQALTRDMAATMSINCPSNGTDKPMGYSWYVYPNATSLANDTYAAANAQGVFSVPRRTRLVIKAHLSGTAVSGALNEDTYYVFSIPEIVRNHAYNITELKITMRGKPNDDDDTPTNSGQLNATVTVQGWAGEETLTFSF